MLVMSLEEALLKTINTDFGLTDRRSSQRRESLNDQDPNHINLNQDFAEVPNPPLSWFKQALLKLTNGAPFQKIFTFIIGSSMCLPLAIVQGLSFLEIEPTKFLCRTSVENSWTSCLKEEICTQNLDNDLYRADSSDPDYFHNWVEKFNMLCMPNYKYGLLGSYLFVGILVTILPLPALSDLYGRKKIFLTTFFLELIVHISMVFNNNLDVQYFLIILTGMAFAGRVVVGLNLILEFMHTK
jgi:hypothetical protein